MKIIDFKTSGYFPTHIILLGIGLSFTGLLLLFTNIILAVVILITSLIILTTHYRLSIDLDNQSFHDYLWIVGMKHGERGKFDNIDYLYITKNKTSQTVNSRITSMTVRKEVFDGFIRFSETNKIHLVTLENKTKLIQKLDAIAQQLNVKVIDYSDAVAQH